MTFPIFSIMEKWSPKLTPWQGPKMRIMVKKLIREAREARNEYQSQESLPLISIGIYLHTLCKKVINDRIVYCNIKVQFDIYS